LNSLRSIPKWSNRDQRKVSIRIVSRAPAPPFRTPDLPALGSCRQLSCSTWLLWFAYQVRIYDRTKRNVYFSHDVRVFACVFKSNRNKQIEVTRNLIKRASTFREIHRLLRKLQNRQLIQYWIRYKSDCTLRVEHLMIRKWEREAATVKAWFNEMPPWMVNVVTHRLPRSLVPLRAIYVSVAFLLAGPFWPQLLQTLRIIHHRSDSTRNDLLAFDLSGLFALLAALFRTRGPWTLHPHRRTWFFAAALRISWFQLRIAQTFIHRLIVAPPHASHSSWLVALKDKWSVEWSCLRDFQVWLLLWAKWLKDAMNDFSLHSIYY